MSQTAETMGGERFGRQTGKRRKDENNGGTKPIPGKRIVNQGAHLRVGTFL